MEHLRALNEPVTIPHVQDGWRHHALCVVDSRASKDTEEKSAVRYYIFQIFGIPVLRRDTLEVAKLAGEGGVEPKAVSQGHGAVC